MQMTAMEAADWRYFNARGHYNTVMEKACSILQNKIARAHIIYTREHTRIRIHINSLLLIIMFFADLCCSRESVVYNHVSYFGELWRSFTYCFRERASTCDNEILYIVATLFTTRISVVGAERPPYALDYPIIGY